MATTQAPNPRASLLSGLRTGGVRSASGPIGGIPHSATPCGSFNFPRYASNVQHYPTFPEEDEDEIGEIPSQKFYVNAGASRPMTAAVDGPNNRFSHQQTRMNANSPPFVPGFAVQASQAQAQAQALQEMQLLQMEVIRLQVGPSSCLSGHICFTDGFLSSRPSRLNNIRRASKPTTSPSLHVNNWRKAPRPSVRARTSIPRLQPAL